MSRLLKGIPHDSDHRPPSGCGAQGARGRRLVAKLILARRETLRSGRERTGPDGVPMNWMARWPGWFPPTSTRRSGAVHRRRRERGHRPVPRRHGCDDRRLPRRRGGRDGRRRRPRGITHDAADRDAIEVGRRALVAASGCPSGSSRSTATDANRFALRLARDVTGRPEGARVQLAATTAPSTRRSSRSTTERSGPEPGNGRSADRSRAHDEVVEFNDIDALERALAHRDVAGACRAGADQHRHRPARRRVSRRPAPADPRHGTLLIIDETHTICAGPAAAPRQGSSPTWSPSASRSVAACRRARSGCRPGDRGPDRTATGTTTSPTSVRHRRHPGGQRSAASRQSARRWAKSSRTRPTSG